MTEYQFHDEYPVIAVPSGSDSEGQYTGEEARAHEAELHSRHNPRSQILFSGAGACCAIALHMHQPMIPAGEGHGLTDAKIISNLQFMLERGSDGDRYNASVYRDCYQRLGDILPTLFEQGFNPRVMFDYSGTLLHGLVQMGEHGVVDKLKRLTTEPALQDTVEWLGTAWGHAVAPSTPVQDFRLHVEAWRIHFGSLFGLQALARVRGFSLPEMALPNHPDVAFECIKALKDSGYDWVMVQEHTVEEVGAERRHLRDPHIPHLLVCSNSQGDSVSIVAFIKTQGSDTKLVAQMQPWYEAQTLGMREIGGIKIPPVVTQISDGENGGVMMNEFPSKFIEVTGLAHNSNTPMVLLSDYLDFIRGQGVRDDMLPRLQPVWQGRIWERCNPGDGKERIEAVIEALSREDHRFNVEGGSWTGDISWIRGYEGVLNPMMRVSSVFHERIATLNIPRNDPRYTKALYYLMLSQTSCYRYWGQGMWTDYGIEICRRAESSM